MNVTELKNTLDLIWENQSLQGETLIGLIS